MPAGRRVYIKSAATRKATGKKYFRVKPKRKMRGKPQRQRLGLRTMNPITRRHLVDTVKHVYDNNAVLTLPDWATFYAYGSGNHRNLNQDFSGNSINIFSQNGFNGANTGNFGTATTGLSLFYAKDVSSTYTAVGAATVMPGYSGQTPYMSNMYNHYQVLGTKLEISNKFFSLLSKAALFEAE